MFNLGAIEIKNLSGNGTLVDGEPIDTLVIDDVSEKTHHVEFGVNEKFILRMVEHEVDANGQPKPSTPAAADGEIEVEVPDDAEPPADDDDDESDREADDDDFDEEDDEDEEEDA